MRPAAEQSVHDRVIQALQEQLEQEGFQDVRTNPDRQKDHTINCDGRKLWPDVFTVENSRATRIHEVETVGTVDAGAAEQWEDYSSCVRPFYLVVPESRQDKAKEILQDRGIPCDGILTYQG